MRRASTRKHAQAPATTVRQRLTRQVFRQQLAHAGVARQQPGPGGGRGGGQRRDHADAGDDDAARRRRGRRLGPPLARRGAHRAPRRRAAAAQHGARRARRERRCAGGAPGEAASGARHNKVLRSTSRVPLCACRPAPGTSWKRLSPRIWAFNALDRCSCNNST